MVYHIIISHRQTEYLCQFPHQEASKTYAVFDAVTVEDLRCAERLGIEPVCSESKGNRGHNRNRGLEALVQDRGLQDEDVVVFFDGDRVPSNYGSHTLLSLLESLDVLLFTCSEYDARMKKIYVPLDSAVRVDTGTLCNPFYSCGFAMRGSAIKAVQQFNGGPLFEPRFKGWGCEDQYLGLVCYHLGLRVGITAGITLRGRVGGDSDRHPEYRESLQTYVDLIREKHLPIRCG